jgi:hypothetical protein
MTSTNFSLLKTTHFGHYGDRYDKTSSIEKINNDMTIIASKTVDREKQGFSIIIKRLK